MGRILNFPERKTLRIWSVMIKQSRDFHAFNRSPIIKPRSVA